MITSLKKNMRLSALGVMLAAATVACNDDYLLSPEPAGDGGDGYIVFRCTDMLETFVGQHNPASRAGGSKNPEEKAINTLHIFFFDDETGNLLTQAYDNFKPYQKVTNTSLIKIPTGEGVPSNYTDQMKKVRIVAIANIDATDEATSADEPANQFFTDYSEGGRIQRAGRDKGGEPHKITKYSDLEEWIYYPRIRMSADGTEGDISKLPESGMPMIGELGNTKLGQKPLDLSKKPTTATVVNMRALMAKVNVSVELEPDQSTEQYPLLKITGYGVRNMPIAVPFRQPTTKVIDGIGGKPTGNSDDERHANYFKKYEVTDVPMFHKGDNQTGNSHFVCDDEAHEFMSTANVTINKDSEPVTFSYYTFENINLPDYNAKRANNVDAFNEALEPQYPTGVKEADKQRWKSTFAYSDRASALILKGEYTTHQGLTYKAQFTVYMGCTVGVPDPNTDFQVKRNHRYDNNIIIHGLDYIRNSDDDVYNFDGRVNVVDDNPFYLAIVNERKVDAHATALPMDVWLMYREDGGGEQGATTEHTSNVKVTIPEDCDWIRMVMVPREEMAATDFKMGTGAEPYFTTDLFERIDNKSILANHYSGAQCGKEVLIESTPTVNNSRARVYFYIDENVPTSNNPVDYGDRVATISVVYDTDKDGGDHRQRTIEIEQRALLRVSGTHSASNSTVPTTWMEYYEEYLEHSDPLDKHESKGELYTGLPWGLSGRAIPNSANDESNTSTYQTYYKTGGFSVTRWAINNTTSISNVTLFNDAPPASAFHYCFGKNKRNSDGSAMYDYRQTTFLGIVTGNEAKGWYMPGIRELELGLVQYYELFTEFRENLYWSAAPAQGSNYYARATGVIVNGNNYSYVESSSGNDGYVIREGNDSTKRIRAFYRVN